MPTSVALSEGKGEGEGEGKGCPGLVTIESGKSWAISGSSFTRGDVDRFVEAGP